jgi:hypothetical protein
LSISRSGSVHRGRRQRGEGVRLRRRKVKGTAPQFSPWRSRSYFVIIGSRKILPQVSEGAPSLSPSPPHDPPADAHAKILVREPPLDRSCMFCRAPALPKCYRLRTANG